jgi:hypothetical protein
MRITRSFALLFLAVLAVATPAAADSLFVNDDPRSGATPDGTSRRPFVTIDDALEEARMRRDAGNNQMIVIHIAPGVYVGGVRIDRNKIKLVGSTQFTLDSAGRPLAPIEGTETLIVPGNAGVVQPLGNREALILVTGAETLSEITIEGLVLDGLRADLGTLDTGGVVATDVDNLTVSRVLASATGIGFVMRYVRGVIEDTAADPTIAGYFLQGGVDAHLVVRRSRSTGLVTGFHMTAGPDFAPWFRTFLPEPAEFRLDVSLEDCLAVGHNNGGFQIIPRSPAPADFIRPTHLVARIVGSTAMSAHPNARGLRIRGFNGATDFALKTVNLTLVGNDFSANLTPASASGATLRNFQVAIIDASGTLAPPAFHYLPSTLGGGGWTGLGSWLTLNGVQIAP